MHGSLDRSCASLKWPRPVAIVSAVAGHEWLVWRARTMMHNDAMPRGCRPAELYEHNLDPTCTPDSTNACISTLRDISTDILSFRDSLRSCLSNVPPRVSYPTPLEPIQPQFSHSSGFLLSSHSTLAQSRFQRQFCGSAQRSLVLYLR
jgi:hypothetical protein